MIKGLNDWTSSYGFMVRVTDNSESCTYRHTFKNPITRDAAIALRDLLDQSREVELSRVYTRGDKFI